MVTASSRTTRTCLLNQRPGVDNHESSSGRMTKYRGTPYSPRATVAIIFASSCIPEANADSEFSTLSLSCAISRRRAVSFLVLDLKASPSSPFAVASATALATASTASDLTFQLRRGRLPGGAKDPALDNVALEFWLLRRCLRHPAGCAAISRASASLSRASANASCRCSVCLAASSAAAVCAFSSCAAVACLASSTDVATPCALEMRSLAASICFRRVWITPA
mmetsp:Transcript_46034/g.144065  ORF Transcript_46034/g.144065 Transcript_46034/m.144065 type:complete len:224 (-) Transcript_46034:114-785(-)